MLKYNNIYLRPIEKEDIPKRTKWLNDEEISSMLVIQYPVSLISSYYWLNKIQGDESRTDFVICISDNNKAIGVIGLTNISKFNKNAEMYIYIGEKDYWGQGYGKIAVNLLLQYAKSVLGLRKIYLYTLDINVKARSLYSKLGFITEGKLVKHIYKNGEYRDLIIQSIFISSFNE